WVTGHTYGVYGPLLNGVTSVLFEGGPGYPEPERYGRIIEKYKVGQFYTTPTVIRSLAQADPALLGPSDLSSLKVLGTVGEPISPEAWRWYSHHLGRDRCPVVDTWWQTETGGHMITPLPGLTPQKPGSCGLPFFGVEPVILDMETKAEIKHPHLEGALFLKRPWPGMARTVYNNHNAYREAYFSQARGLFFTGDGAKTDEDGYYYITGRIDDVITVHNHRLGSAELESALARHRQVAEVAVVGLPDPDQGQRIVAFVALNPGAERSARVKEELVALVKSEIGPIAAIDAIHWADSLPKTLSGKILHRLLKKIASGQADQLGDVSTLADPTAVEALVRDFVANDRTALPAGGIEAAQGPTVARRRILDKFGQPYELGLAGRDDSPLVMDMYDRFEPKKTSQGLPPENNEARREWVGRLFERGENYLVWRAGEVIGHATLLSDFVARDAEYLIFVQQHYRGRGLGTFLTGLAVERARAMGLELIWLTVENFNFWAINLYRKFGFIFCEDQGWDRMMILRL
ncbi:MAG: GNAT family N-acetyltransferase, partial [Thermodesulfobacteriota bacterium]